MSEPTAPDIDADLEAQFAELREALGDAYDNALQATVGLDLVAPEDVGCAIAYAELMLDAQDTLLALREAATRVGELVNARVQAILDQARHTLEERRTRH